MIKSHVHKLINGDKLSQNIGQQVDQSKPNMLVRFGMGENVDHKMICRTRSINPKKYLAKSIGKIVRLTENAAHSQLIHYKRDSQITRSKISYSLIKPQPFLSAPACGYLLQLT